MENYEDPINDGLRAEMAAAASFVDPGQTNQSEENDPYIASSPNTPSKDPQGKYPCESLIERKDELEDSVEEYGTIKKAFGGNLLSQKYKKLFIILAGIFVLGSRYAMLAVILISSGIVIGVIYSESVRDTLTNIKPYNDQVNADTSNDDMYKYYNPRQRNSVKRMIIISPKLSQMSAMFSESITTMFVTDLWYHKINHSENKDFQESVKSTIDEAIVSLCERFLGMKMAPVLSLASEKVIKHAREFCVYQATGGDLDKYIDDNPDSNFSKFGSKKDTVEKLRKLSLIMAIELLPKNERSSHIVFSFVHEILATHVLFPLVKMISDPNYFNKKLLIFLKKQLSSKVLNQKKHKKAYLNQSASEGYVGSGFEGDRTESLKNDISHKDKYLSPTVPELSKEENLLETDLQNSTKSNRYINAFTSSKLDTKYPKIIFRKVELRFPQACCDNLGKIYAGIKYGTLLYCTKPRVFSEVLEWTEKFHVPYLLEGYSNELQVSKIELSLTLWAGEATEVIVGEREIPTNTLMTDDGTYSKSEILIPFNLRAPSSLQGKWFTLTLEVAYFKNEVNDNSQNIECITNDIIDGTNEVDSDIFDISPSSQQEMELNTVVPSSVTGIESANKYNYEGSENFNSENETELVPLSEVKNLFDHLYEVLRLTKYVKSGDSASLVLFCYYLCSKRKQLEDRDRSDALVLLSGINTSFRTMCDDPNICISESDISELKSYLNQALDTFDYSYLDLMIDLCCKNLRDVVSEFRMSCQDNNSENASQKSLDMGSLDSIAYSTGAKEKQVFSTRIGYHDGISSEPIEVTKDKQQELLHTLTASTKSGGEIEISMCIRNIIFFFKKTNEIPVKDEDIRKTLMDLIQDTLKRIDLALSGCNNSIKIKVMVEVKVDLQCYYQALSNSSNAIEIIESILAVGRFHLSNLTLVLRYVSKNSRGFEDSEAKFPPCTNSSISNCSDDCFFSIDIFTDSKSCSSVIKSYDDLKSMYSHLRNHFPDITKDYLNEFPPKLSPGVLSNEHEVIDKIKGWLLMSLTDPLINRIDVFLQFLCIGYDVLNMTCNLLLQKYHVGKPVATPSMAAHSKLSRKIKLARSSIMKTSSYFNNKQLPFNLLKGSFLSDSYYNQTITSKEPNKVTDTENFVKSKRIRKKSHSSSKKAEGDIPDNEISTVTRVYRDQKLYDTSASLNTNNLTVSTNDPDTPHNSLPTSTTTTQKHQSQSFDSVPERNWSLNEDVYCVKSSEPNEPSDIEGEIVIVECLFAITEELFVLSNPEKWIRQMGITVLKPIIMRMYGESIASIVGKRYKSLISQEMLTNLLERILHNLHPKSKNPQNQLNSDDESLTTIVDKLSPDEVKMEILELLSTMNFSGSLERASKYLGKSSVSRALRLLFFMIQNENINRSLVVSILGLTLKSCFGMI